MANVIDHYAEALQRSNAQQRHIARFGEDHFIVRFVAFRAEDGIANFPFNSLLCGGSKDSLPSRSDPSAYQDVRRQPCQFRTSVNYGRNWFGRKLLTFRVPCGYIDLEHAHNLENITSAGTALLSQEGSGIAERSREGWFPSRQLHA